MLSHTHTQQKLECTQTCLIRDVSGHNLTIINRRLIYKVKVHSEDRSLTVIRKKKLEIIHTSVKRERSLFHGLYMESSGRTQQP